jgi:predicted RecA/RadA family phage recombinase
MAGNKFRIFKGKRGHAAHALFLLMGALGLLALAPRLAAVNGRDFAGSYDVTNATQSGDTYTLTFSARVFNYSGADVASATINLGDSVLAGQTYATFPGINISSRASAVVSSSVTIPAREYQSWQQGGTPYLTIQFTDTTGNNRLEAVELTRGPVGEGQ